VIVAQKRRNGRDRSALRAAGLPVGAVCNYADGTIYLDLPEAPPPAAAGAAPGVGTAVLPVVRPRFEQQDRAAWAPVRWLGGT